MDGTEHEVDFVVTVQAIGDFSRLSEADLALIQHRIELARQVAETALYAWSTADADRFKALMAQLSTPFEGASR